MRVMKPIKEWLSQKGITRASLRWLHVKQIASDWFLKLYLTQEQRKMLIGTGDPIRYGTLLLSLEQISKDGIPGSLAECGVYKGMLSKFTDKMLPDPRLFLFDTFKGFDQRDSNTYNDERFTDTSEQSVLHYIGNVDNVSYVKDTSRIQRLV